MTEYRAVRREMGRNSLGLGAVERYDSPESRSPVETIVSALSYRQATIVAQALNAAYATGYHNGSDDTAGANLATPSTLPDLATLDGVVTDHRTSGRSDEPADYNIGRRRTSADIEAARVVARCTECGEAAYSPRSTTTRTTAPAFVNHLPTCAENPRNRIPTADEAWGEATHGYHEAEAGDY